MTFAVLHTVRPFSHVGGVIGVRTLRVKRRNPFGTFCATDRAHLAHCSGKTPENGRRLSRSTLFHPRIYSLRGGIYNLVRTYNQDSAHGHLFLASLHCGDFACVAHISPHLGHEAALSRNKLSLGASPKARPILHLRLPTSKCLAALHSRYHHHPCPYTGEL